MSPTDISQDERALIDGFVTKALSQKMLVGPDAMAFTTWIAGFGEYCLYSSSPHPSICPGMGFPYEFPWHATHLKKLIEHSLDSADEGDGYNIDWAVTSFKRGLEELDPDFNRYLVALQSNLDDIAWILVTAGDRGQGGWEDEEYVLFATPLDVENQLRDWGYIFPNGEIPSGQRDAFTDVEIQKLIEDLSDSRW